MADKTFRRRPIRPGRRQRPQRSDRVGSAEPLPHFSSELGVAISCRLVQDHGHSSQNNLTRVVWLERLLEDSRFTSRSFLFPTRCTSASRRAGGQGRSLPAGNPEQEARGAEIAVSIQRSLADVASTCPNSERSVHGHPRREGVVRASTGRVRPRCARQSAPFRNSLCDAHRQISVRSLIQQSSSELAEMDGFWKQMRGHW